mgnify:CR=1 FL=1
MNKSDRVGINVGRRVYLTPILTIVFVVLKLTHVINWSWVWILSPLWIGASISVLSILILTAFTLITKKDWWE